MTLSGFFLSRRFHFASSHPIQQQEGEEEEEDHSTTRRRRRRRRRRKVEVSCQSLDYIYVSHESPLCINPGAKSWRRLGGSSNFKWKIFNDLEAGLGCFKLAFVWAMELCERRGAEDRRREKRDREMEKRG